MNISQPLNVSPEHPRMIVDWSVLAYISWFKMRSPGYIAESPLEIEEFARNIAEYLLYLVHRFTPSELVLAVDDSKNWRASYYETYYKTAIDFYRVRDESSGWIVVLDSECYHVKQHDATEKWFIDKLTKKEYLELKLDDLEKYTPFINGIAPEWLIELAPDCPKTVWEHPDADGLRLIVPKYKGNRGAAKWDFETPKDEWKILTRNLAGNIAPVMTGRAICIDWAEGDDVIAAYCLADTVVPTILVSIDSDLRQLCIPCIGLAIYNPKKTKFTTPTKEAAQLEILCKILGGDTSDNIAGVSIPGRAPFSPVSWDEVGSVKSGKNTVKWVRDLLDSGKDLQGIRDFLDSMGDLKTLDRNKILVHLGCIPESLMQTLTNAVEFAPPPEPKYKLSDFGLSDAHVLSIQNRAHNDRVAEGGYK